MSMTQMNVSIDYTMDRDMVLDNVNILIPLGTHDAPSVASVDGQYQHNSAEGSLLWHQDQINSSYVHGEGRMPSLSWCSGLTD